MGCQLLFAPVPIDITDDRTARPIEYWIKDLALFPEDKESLNGLQIMFLLLLKGC
jgi:hypothetical protein